LHLWFTQFSENRKAKAEWKKYWKDRGKNRAWNHFVWTAVGVACFFFLGPFGGLLLTAVLYNFDVFNTVWECSNREKELEDFLGGKIDAQGNAIDEKDILAKENISEAYLHSQRPQYHETLKKIQLLQQQHDLPISELDSIYKKVCLKPEVYQEYKALIQQQHRFENLEIRRKNSVAKLTHTKKVHSLRIGIAVALSGAATGLLLAFICPPLVGVIICAIAVAITLDQIRRQCQLERKKPKKEPLLPEDTQDNDQALEHYL